MYLFSSIIYFNSVSLPVVDPRSQLIGADQSQTGEDMTDRSRAFDQCKKISGVKTFAELTQTIPKG